jgi:hypothetical protein
VQTNETIPASEFQQWIKNVNASSIADIALDDLLRGNGAILQTFYA